ncbi:MAG: nitrilase-related carbon-nitrogen hydrolase [Anaerolineae bacterium]|nr:hypothetical protein [Candidatus Roseilinea sp.]MDW8449988.1 nitrilase-related carbon-nitrogen hydrolase [Anaerolineae bacterium]
MKGNTQKINIWLRLGAGVVLSLASAGLLTLAFPPYGLWPLIWLSFVPMLIAQHRVLPRKTSSLAPAIAIGVWLGSYLTPMFGGSGTYMAWLPLLIGGITLLASSGERAFHERTGYRWFVAQGALTWVGFEMLRSFLPMMGTWAFVANTLHSQPWLIQPVSIFSIFGLGLLIMLVNYGLGLGALYLFDRRWQLDPSISVIGSSAARNWLLGISAALALWVGLSLALYRAPAAPTVRVAALHYDAGKPGGAPNKFRELTYQAAQDGARIIVWPEVAIEGDPQVTGTAEFQRLAAETNAYLTLGYIVRVTEQAFRNEATVLSPDGQFLGVFGKDHPVVFGGETSLTRGTYPVYDTPLGRIGTMICYDADFTDTARKITRNGAQLILLPSRDWPGIATTHYTHAVFRAIENRVSVVRSDGSGNDSVVIDPYGNILALALTPGGDREGQVLVADAPLGTGDSLVVQLGDWMGWISLAGMAFFVVYDPITKMRAKRSAAPSLQPNQV